MDKWLVLVDELTRHVVTLAVTGALVYAFITKTVSADVFMGVAGLVIAFWFKSNGGSTPSK